MLQVGATRIKEEEEEEEEEEDQYSIKHVGGKAKWKENIKKT
jgi:hypothetical protein